MLTKEQLINVIDTEVQEFDSKTIDALYQVLYRHEIEQATASALAPLWNNEGERRTILSIFMNTEGMYRERLDFIQELGKTSFIIEEEIFKQNVIQSIPTWFNGSDFAYRQFIELSSLAGSSVGSGEIALSVFCPSSEHNGRSAEAGDLCMFGKNIEVKSKVTRSSPGGRLHDSAKAEYDWTESRALFKELGYPILKLSLPQYTEKYRDKLTLLQKKKVASTIINGSFKFVDTADSSMLFQYLIDGTKDQIQKEWAFLGFENYKNYSNFEGMLLLDLYHRVSIYTEDIRQSEHIIKINTVNLFGDTRGAMPQVTVKTT